MAVRWYIVNIYESIINRLEEIIIMLCFNNIITSCSDNIKIVYYCAVHHDSQLLCSCTVCHHCMHGRGEKQFCFKLGCIQLHQEVTHINMIHAWASNKQLRMFTQEDGKRYHWRRSLVWVTKTRCELYLGMHVPRVTHGSFCIVVAI